AASAASTSSPATDATSCTNSTPPFAPTASTTRFLSCRRPSKNGACETSPGRALEPVFQFSQRFHPRQVLFAVSPGHIKQHCIHPRIARSCIINRVHVAHIEARCSSGPHPVQGRFKNFRMRFLVPNDSRVGDALKAISDPAAPQNCVDPAVRVRNHGDFVILANPFQRVASPRQNLVP